MPRNAQARESHSILITGATSGLGRALALAYAKPGITLHLLGRSAERMNDVRMLCKEKGAQVYSALIDVRDKESMESWVRAQDVLQPIDLVIANAGISAGTGDVGENAAQAEMIFSVNVQGILNTVWAVVPMLCERKHGAVAIISSMAGLYPIPSAPAYSASKACVRYYGEALRAQLAHSGISVTMVYPGFIDTPMTRVNPFPMPLLMQVDDAATRVVHAISCGKPCVFFPLMLAFLVRALHFLPFSWVQPRFFRVPAKPQFP